MKCGSDIHVSFRMNCNNSADPLTFLQALSLGQHVNVSNTLDSEQIPAELMLDFEFNAK